MGKTLKEWTGELGNMSPEDRKEIKAALNRLEAWPLFNEEFGWTGLFVLAACIDTIEEIERTSKRLNEMKEIR